MARGNLHIGIDTLAAHGRKTGIGTYVSSLVNSLLRIDGENRYTLFVSHENAGIFDDAPNCRKARAPRAMDDTRLRVPWEHTALAHQINRQGLDLLHGPTFVTPFFCRAPGVITIHDMTWFTHPREHVPLKVWYYRALIPWAARRARHVIAITESTRRDILRLLRLPGDKVSTIYYGVDAIFRPVTAAGRLAAVRAQYACGAPFLLFVGMLEPRKNLLRIIEAFHALAQSGYTGRLVMAGNRGWGYAAAAERVRELGLEGRVIFTGPVLHQELPALFSAAEAFVYPSLYEGFGLPPLEALACGVPVVTANVSSLPEVVGDAAVLVDPLSTADLVAALRSVLGDAGLRAELRTRGLRQAARFDWEETARRTLEVYVRATAPRRALATPPPCR